MAYGRKWTQIWQVVELLLARTAVLGLRPGLGLRCALRHINNNLNLIVRVVCFYGIAGQGHATSLFAWAGCRCVYLAVFPLPAR